MLLFSTLISTATLALAQNNAAAQNATSSAFVYGYPLLAFQKLADLFVPGNNTNTIVHLRGLATTFETFVVKPNVDTLYSTAIFDISQNDVVLTVPDVPESQFALFSFYDPYGDNFVNLGTDTPHSAGNFTVRRPSNGTFAYGVQPTSANNSTSSVIYSPTAYGVLLIRWLVNATNLDAVHSYQDNTQLRSGAVAQNGTPSLFSLNATTNDNFTPAERTLQLLAKYARWDEPQSATSRTNVNSQLQAAGISSGTYTPPSGLDLEAANRTALATITASATDPANNVVLNNGWSIPLPNIQGTFKNGTDFAYRAAVAFSEYLQLQAPLAVYPTWQNSSTPDKNDIDGTYYLGPNDAYVYTFSGKPPLSSTGFWSLTAYENNFLIPNSLNRSEIGDRSNLTYYDGSLVYGQNTGDGRFQVLIQAADNPPPKNWTSNWIPGPAGGGNISAPLRFYGAKPELLNGTYAYPVVEKRAAIVASSTTSSGTMPSSTTSSASREAYIDARKVVSLMAIFAFTQMTRLV